MRADQWRQQFTVTAVAGVYASEVVYLRDGDKNSGNADPARDGEGFDRVLELTIDVETLPAGAQIEVDILQANADPSIGGTYNTARKTYNATGLQGPIFLSGVYGVRIRCKSGGTAGNAVASLWWLACEELNAQ